MRCMCCNRPFTPARYIKSDGKVEFEKYCKRCVNIPYHGYKYTDDHEYQHQMECEPLTTTMSGVTLPSVINY